MVTAISFFRAHFVPVGCNAPLNGLFSGSEALSPPTMTARNGGRRRAQNAPYPGQGGATKHRRGLTVQKGPRIDEKGELRSHPNRIELRQSRVTRLPPS